MVEQSSPIAVYQLHVWLREITPLIWRRLLVRTECAITRHMLLAAAPVAAQSGDEAAVA
jgi:hypothetical protein